jgi:predicted Fe-S protein YdhL (DUF1289 family)
MPMHSLCIGVRNIHAQIGFWPGCARTGDEIA